ncbi:YagK/YfjJ domain-containing protein [Psychrobacter proteolyticus]|uniref:Inovirus-type Gp2 protein n=1 Tax=Psychrobacter proteolyticus TaxID=147825 RepID=A0ABV0D6T0_9GAMM
MTTLKLTHETVVAKVDKLVNDILTPNNKMSIQQISEQLNTYYQPMTLLFDDELEYTNSIKWFIGSGYLVCGSCYPNEIFWNEDMTQSFLRALVFYRDEFNTAITNFAYQEQRNGYSLYNYMSYFLKEYSRVLIVRVDLKIKSEFAHLIGIEKFHNLMDELRDSLGRKRGCFEHLRGHAWAIEQGTDTGGLHCHLLLIYNGDKRQKDWFLGDAVGKKWIEITDGFGSYYNCNTSEHKSTYKKQGTLGIGMIHKNNAVEVKNAINAALYLTRPDKYEQRLKAWTPSMRSFGRGTTPKD